MVDTEVVDTEVVDTEVVDTEVVDTEAKEAQLLYTEARDMAGEEDEVDVMGEDEVDAAGVEDEQTRWTGRARS